MERCRPLFFSSLCQITSSTLSVCISKSFCLEIDDEKSSNELVCHMVLSFAKSQWQLYTSIPRLLRLHRSHWFCHNISWVISSLVCQSTAFGPSLFGDMAGRVIHLLFSTKEDVMAVYIYLAFLWHI